MELIEIRSDCRKLKNAIAVLRDLEAKYGEIHFIHRSIPLDVPLVSAVQEEFLKCMRGGYIDERTAAAKAEVDTAISAEEG